MIKHKQLSIIKITMSLILVGLIFNLTGCATLSPHSVEMCDELSRMVDVQEADRMKMIDEHISKLRWFADKWMNRVTIPDGIIKQMKKPDFCKKLQGICKEKCEGAKFLQGFMEKFMAAVMRKRTKIAADIDQTEADLRSRARIQFSQYRTVLNSLKAHLKSYLKAKQLRQELTKKIGVDTEKFEQELDRATKKMEKFYTVEE